MPKKRQYTQLVVQRLPEAGIVVRFRTRRLHRPGDVRRVRKELESLAVPERLLLVDLTNLEYLNSAMLNVLVQMERTLRELHGKMSLCGLPPAIEEVFRICKLHLFFEIYPDLESALGDDSRDFL